VGVTGLAVAVLLVSIPADPVGPSALSTGASVGRILTFGFYLRFVTPIRSPTRPGDIKTKALACIQHMTEPVATASQISVDWYPYCHLQKL
jgi:uncharacterized membrane protein